jgi:hypothetical protein
MSGRMSRWKAERSTSLPCPSALPYWSPEGADGGAVDIQAAGTMTAGGTGTITRRGQQSPCWCPSAPPRSPYEAARKHHLLDLLVEGVNTGALLGTVSSELAYEGPGISKHQRVSRLAGIASTGATVSPAI